MDENIRLQALKKILDDRDRLILKRVETRAAVAAAEAADAALIAELRDLQGAGRVFEQTVAVPTDLRDYASRQALDEAMKRLKYDAWVPFESKPFTREEIERIKEERRKPAPSSRGAPAVKNSFAELSSSLATLKANIQNFVEPSPAYPLARNSELIAPAAQVPFETMRISDRVTLYLAENQSRGIKAAEIRTYLKQAYAIETHEKTVGMTLYRLSQERPPKVHRKGHTWFFGPPPAETENPGGETPGPINKANEERSVDDA